MLLVFCGRLSHSSNIHWILTECLSLKVKVYNIIVYIKSVYRYTAQCTEVMQEKDEIDFRNQLLPDKDQPQPKKIAKEEDKPLLTSQMMEDLQMLLAVFLIIVVTLLIIIFKVGGGDQSSVLLKTVFHSQIYYFSPTVDDRTTTFRPLEQNKNSNQKYNGPGFIPCNGFLPCKLDHFRPAYNEERKQDQMAEWNGVEG